MIGNTNIHHVTALEITRQKYGQWVEIKVITDDHSAHTLSLYMADSKAPKVLMDGRAEELFGKKEYDLGDVIKARKEGRLEVLAFIASALLIVTIIIASILL